MTSEKFAAKNWIDRLALALRSLAEAQESYLPEYYGRSRRLQIVFGEQGGPPPAFPLADVRTLYLMACHSHVWGQEEYYAALCAALDPVRVILRSHPTLERVASPVIGQDEFWMEILKSGTLTSPTNLIAGLMARAAELSGNSFRTAAGELNALLTPAAESGVDGMKGGLDVGYDAVLFYGLPVKERIDIVNGMAILPFEQVRAFVDQSFVEELAPSRAAFRDWRSVGAVVRPFRWRPMLRRTGYLGELKLRNPEPFFRDAQAFLELLAVARAAPVLSIAALSDCIDRTASQLLGQEYRGSEHGRRSAERFDGFEECPELVPGALAQARAAFEDRKSERYAQMAPIVSRLSAALARDGGFADENRIVDVAVALEQMYDLPEQKISRTLRDRVSGFLGTDAASRERIKESVKEFYDTRSNIVHSRSGNVSPRKKFEAFGKGFDIARRTLFKLLHEGRPENWDELMIGGG